MAALFFDFKNVPLVQKIASAVFVHRSCRSVHEIPEDVSVSHIDYDIDYDIGRFLYQLRCIHQHENNP